MHQLERMLPVSPSVSWPTDLMVLLPVRPEGRLVHCLLPFQREALPWDPKQAPVRSLHGRLCLPRRLLHTFPKRSRMLSISGYVF